MCYYRNITCTVLTKCSLQDFYHTALTEYPGSKQPICIFNFFVTSSCQKQNPIDDERRIKSAARCIWTFEGSSSTELSSQPAAGQTSGSVKTLMTPAESSCSQWQADFLDAVCQSGSQPDQTGGPVLQTEKEGEKEKERTEERYSFDFWNEKNILSDNVLNRFKLG